MNCNASACQTRQSAQVILQKAKIKEPPNRILIFHFLLSFKSNLELYNAKFTAYLFIDGIPFRLGCAKPKKMIGNLQSSKHLLNVLTGYGSKLSPPKMDSSNTIQQKYIKIYKNISLTPIFYLAYSHSSKKGPNDLLFLWIQIDTSHHEIEDKGLIQDGVIHTPASPSIPPSHSLLGGNIAGFRMSSWIIKSPMQRFENNGE